MLVVAVGCTKVEEKKKIEPQPHDTIYTEAAALAIYANNPAKAVIIIDSAEIVGNLDKNHANFLRAKVYTQSIAGQQFDKAQRILEELMESDYVVDLDNRESVIDLLINISRRHGDKEQWLHWATEKVEICRQRNEKTEALRTEAEIGLVLAQLGEVEKGLAKINEVIDILDDQRHFNEMDACIIGIKRKINVLDLLEKPGDIIPLAQRIIKKIDDYRQYSDEYADGSFRMPSNAEQIDDYCDFYIAQAYAFLAKAYADLGITNSAKCYVELFEELDYSTTYSGRMFISSAWCKLGYFDKMLSIYDEATERLGSDTINIDYAKILYGRAVAADADGNHNIASDYWKRYVRLQNLLNKKQEEGQAYHYAAKYHLQEEHMNTEREQAKAKNSRNLAWAGLALVLVSVFFIIRLLMQRRAINRKNHVLTEQISESIKYKKIIESPKPVKSKPQASSSKLDIESLSDDKFFKYLGDVIRREELFRDPSFGRQVLMDRFHINERRIGAVFSRCGGLPDFIRNLRLEYACQLMTDNPDMSLSDIAEASGFSTLTVFGRDFKRKYDVTPSYYRSQITADNNN